MSNTLLEQRWPWLVAAALVILAFLSTLVEVRIGPRTRPMGTVEDILALKQSKDVNVLFVLIDTLRSDHMGCYGHENDTSPVMDDLASSGIRFERHLSQSSWTKCSMASMWTGMYPTRVGITRFNEVISEEAVLPAEVLTEAGFRSVGIYRNGWVAQTFGFEQGFDVYKRPKPLKVPKSVLIDNPTLTTHGTDSDVIASAREFLRIHGHERWFMYLHLMDLHEYTYDQESALFGGSYSGIYDNSIRFVDGTIERLMALLDEQGYSENTIVAIASDHGEAFKERGLEGHARAVFKESTEVPFILSLPFKLEQGIVVESNTSNIDIWPTLFDLLGLPQQPDIDGRSLVPDIMAAARGETAPEEGRTGISHLDQNWGNRAGKPVNHVAVVEGNLRYVRSYVGGNRIESLFDRHSDPLELNSLAVQEHETLERLSAIADAYLEKEPPWARAPVREMGEMELNQLRALGYAID